MKPTDFSDHYLSEQKMVLDMLSREHFSQVADCLLEAYEQGKHIFIFGNGGSGSTASHFANDINKGASLGLEKRFRVICLNDNIPTMLAYANDEGYDGIFLQQLKNFLKAGDVVIGVSGSGNSPNVICAVEYALTKGAKTIAFTGFDGGKLAKIVNIPFIAPVYDMQKVEDVHLILTHMLMQYFSLTLASSLKEEPSISFKSA